MGYITRKNYTITGAIGIIHSINSINPTNPSGMENPTDVIMMKRNTKSMNPAAMTNVTKYPNMMHKTALYVNNLSADPPLPLIFTRLKNV